MNTGNTSKTALSAARIALLAGVSAASLSLGMSAAHAQAIGYDPTVLTTTPGSGSWGAYDTVGGSAQLSVNADGAGNAGFIVYNGTTGYSTTITGNGLTTNGWVTVTAGASNQTLGGYRLTSNSFTGNSSALSGDSLSFTNSSSATTAVVNADGSAQFAAQGVNGGVQISNSGNVSVGNGLTVYNGAAINGGLNVTGGSKTDGVSTFTNTGTAGQGTTTINGAYASLSSGNGSITLDATADPTFQVTNGTSTTTIQNGSITATDSITSEGTLTVDGKSTFGSGGNTTIGANGNVTVGTAASNANMTVNGNTQLNGNLSVANGANVSMGDNVVHDVATPIVGTDAANKAYVDKGVSKAYEGTAIALSLEQPIFMPGQSFAIRAGWGDFEGQNGFGVSAAGVIARNVFGYGSTVVVDAGVGAGTDYNQVAGRAGVTFGFGGGTVPLK